MIKLKRLNVSFLMVLLISVCAMGQKKQLGGLSFINVSNKPFLLYLNDQQVNPEAAPAVRVIGLTDYSYKISITTPGSEVDELRISKLYVCNNEGKLKETGYEMKLVNQHYNLRKSYFREVDTSFQSGFLHFILKDGHYQPWLVEVQDTSLSQSSNINTDKLTSNQLKDTLVYFEQATSPTKASEKGVKKNTVTSTPPLIRVPDNWTCQHSEPMESLTYQLAFTSISSIKNQSNLYKSIRQLIDTSCMTTVQLHTFLLMLNSESYRLDLVKLAFSHTTDIRNYFELRDLFADGRNKAAFIKFITAW